MGAELRLRRSGSSTLARGADSRFRPAKLAVIRGTRASERDLEQVTTCLTQALDRIGFGAKPAVGYGRFRTV